eukprot:544640_1
MPKRKNKNKNKRTQEEDLENRQNDTEPKLSKREKRRQKKTQKQEEEEQIECNPEEEHKDQFINESNKEDEKIYLNSIKEKQQQALLEIGNNLLSNLDDKYFPFFTKEFENIWEQQMIEIVLFYDQKHICNNLQSLQSETLFAEKKHELESIWNEEIFALLLEDFETTLQHKTIKTKANKCNKSQSNRKQKQTVSINQTEEIEEKAETEEKYFENENETAENTSECPICLADDYTMLCELDCYVYRSDNIKHCICSECVRKLFKSNRWYQRAKCPFCRHTIHRDVIMNNSINASELSESENEGNEGGHRYINRNGLHELYWNSYRQFLQQRQNIFEQNSSWNNYELNHRNGSVYHIKYCFVLLLIGIVCFYYSYMWIGLIWIIISFLIFVMNMDNDELFNNLGEEMRIFYEERTVPRRVQRSLQHVRNRNVRVRNNRKDSNMSGGNRGNRVNRYRNKIKNKKLKVGRQTQKYNKRFRNRNFR